MAYRKLAAAASVSAGGSWLHAASHRWRWQRGGKTTHGGDCGTRGSIGVACALAMAAATKGMA